MHGLKVSKDKNLIQNLQKNVHGQIWNNIKNGKTAHVEILFDHMSDCIYKKRTNAVGWKCNFSFFIERIGRSGGQKVGKK